MDHFCVFVSVYCIHSTQAIVYDIDRILNTSLSPISSECPNNALMHSPMHINVNDMRTKNTAINWHGIDRSVFKYPAILAFVFASISSDERYSSPSLLKSMVSGWSELLL